MFGMYSKKRYSYSKFAYVAQQVLSSSTRLIQQWVGCTPKGDTWEDTWEPLECFDDTKMVDTFWAR